MPNEMSYRMLTAYENTLKNDVYTYCNYEQVQAWHTKRGTSLKERNFYGVRIAEILRALNGKDGIRDGKLSDEDLKTLKDLEKAYKGMSRADVYDCIYYMINNSKDGLANNITLVDVLE